MKNFLFFSGWAARHHDVLLELALKAAPVCHLLILYPHPSHALNRSEELHFSLINNSLMGFNRRQSPTSTYP
jgi:hypothetical protein